MSNANAEDSSQDDLARRWEEIVAELGDMPDAHDDTDSLGESASDRDASDVPATKRVAAGPRDWPTSKEVEALEEEQSHFSAPTEVDLGEPVVAVRVSWLVIGLVIAGAAVSFALGRVLTTWELIGGTFILIGAVTMLIRNLPEDRHDDPDLGAQV